MPPKLYDSLVRSKRVFRDNKIGDQGAEAFAKALESNKSLKDLDLRSN